jgi:DNA-binding HxlR family transcriptional regulator
MKGYGQFCPVAKACEVFGERWTPLVVRELMCGSTHFNEIRRGVPLMSPSLLAKRLRQLEAAGIVERLTDDTGRNVEYRLTRSGEDLQPIVQMLGMWGARWVESTLTSEENLDAGLLMWDIRRTLDISQLPAAGRAVIKFRFTDVPKAKSLWWLVADGDEFQLCLTDPGHEIDMLVDTDLRTLTRVWIGEEDLSAGLRAGTVRGHEQPQLVEHLPRWRGERPFARSRRERCRRAASG